MAIIAQAVLAPTLGGRVRRRRMIPSCLLEGFLRLEEVALQLHLWPQGSLRARAPGAVHAFPYT